MDLNEAVTLFKTDEHGGPQRVQARQQCARGTVAYPQPDHLRAGPSSTHPLGEVFVLGDHDRSELPGVVPYWIVLAELGSLWKVFRNFL